MSNINPDGFLFRKNSISGSKIPKYGTYGVSIDLANSNPETSVTYTDDAIGMVGNDPKWNLIPIFKNIKPCVMQNGVVKYYLNPDNFAKKVDGTASVITGADGDVMIEIPKIGYIISMAGNILSIKVTNNINDIGFKYHAHTRSISGDCDKLYIGAYLGSISGGKLRSVSGILPTGNQTISNFRSQARANGTGYDLVSFYPITLLQCLFIIRYKNLNSQSALGRGYVDGNVSTTITGGTNTKGMCFGEKTGKFQIKFMGIEDFWGNSRYWVDGMIIDNGYNIFTGYKGFNDSGSGYTNRGNGASTHITGHMKRPQGTSETGFIVKDGNGSTSTYFSDYVSLYPSGLPSFGGEYNSGDSVGAFYLGIGASVSSISPTISGRLMFL